MSERIRIDKWLWHARFHRTRVVAREAARSGRIRVNGARVEKAGGEVGPGDVLTIPFGREVRIVRIVACGIRRGPATEARALYRILDDTVLDPGAPGP